MKRSLLAATLTAVTWTSGLVLAPTLTACSGEIAAGTEPEAGAGADATPATAGPDTGAVNGEDGAPLADAAPAPLDGAPVTDGGLAPLAPWWQNGWVTSSSAAPVSAYSHRPLNVGPNFYNLVADHEKWRAYHGDFDMVNGSAMRGWTKQDWATYIGGPVAAGPTSVVASSWLQLLESTHTRPWFDYAGDWPNLWVVLNCVSMPTSSHSGTDLTAAEQAAIVEDIIAGRKDADLVMLGRRLRHQVEHLADGARAGSAARVMLRINWEFQHTTSLGIGGQSFLNYYVSQGLTEAQAAEKYRTMMHVWCAKVREGYAMDYAPAVRLRIAISFAHMRHRGIPMKDYIAAADDYDLVDMMYHPSRDTARTADQVWNALWKPGSPGGRYAHADALAAAVHFDLAYGTLESGPATAVDPQWGDLYTPERGYVTPGDWAAGQAVTRYQYRITDEHNIYQVLTKGPGDSSVKPTHDSGRATLSDGYEWVFRLNLGRKLSPYELGELYFRDFHELTGRSAFIGSFHPNSCNPNFVSSDWSTADKDFDSPTSKASDWRRFVQMRKRWLGVRPL